MSNNNLSALNQALANAGINVTPAQLEALQNSGFNMGASDLTGTGNTADSWAQQLSGWGNILQGAGNIFNAGTNLWSAYQSNKLLRDQFNWNKALAQTNLTNQTNAFNNNLYDKYRARGLFETGNADQYMDQYNKYKATDTL